MKNEMITVACSCLALASSLCDRIYAWTGDNEVYGMSKTLNEFIHVLSGLKGKERIIGAE